jgi:hypothetical protein
MTMLPRAGLSFTEALGYRGVPRGQDYALVADIPRWSAIDWCIEEVELWN